MKTISWICVTFGLLASGLSANENLYLKSRWVDGLPLWLAEAGMAELEVKPGTRDIDLSHFSGLSGLQWISG